MFEKLEYVIDNWVETMEMVKTQKEKEKLKTVFVKCRKGCEERKIEIINDNEKDDVNNKNLKKKLWWKVLCILEYFDQDFSSIKLIEKGKG